KFGAEFRRFSLDRSKPGRFDEFYGLLQHVHHIPNVELLVGYADVHGDLLPINNDDNYQKAISTRQPPPQAVSAEERSALRLALLATLLSTLLLLL
ncbi:unnamed protein product, partial [Tetraodon nigroviridis]